MFAYLRAVDALPTLATMTPAERRSLLIAGYHRSTAPLTDHEASVLDAVVDDWADQWANPVGDTLLPLLADTLGVPIHVFQPVSDPAGASRGVLLRYGPTTNTRALEVHYTGLNHYSASDAHSPAVAPVAVLETQRAAAGDGTARGPEVEPEAEPEVEPQEPEFRPGGAGTEADEDPEEGRLRVAVSRAQGPETFARSLAELLAAPAPGTPASVSVPTPTWSRTRDPHAALLTWAQADVAVHGAPDDAALPAPDTSVSTDALAEIGALTEELRVQAIMQNGTVTVADAGLDDPARLALVLARPGDTLGYTSALAALVARITGRPVRVLGPDGRTDRFGPADGTPLTLYFDGNRFSVTPPAPGDD